MFVFGAMLGATQSLDSVLFHKVDSDCSFRGAARRKSRTHFSTCRQGNRALNPKFQTENLQPYILKNEMCAPWTS